MVMCGSHVGYEHTFYLIYCHRVVRQKNKQMSCLVVFYYDFIFFTIVGGMNNMIFSVTRETDVRLCFSISGLA